jgi:uncharacterized protein YwqG
MNFTEIAAEHGFAKDVDVIRKYLLPCVGFTLREGDHSGVGTSRLGGKADLPPDCPLPTWSKGPLHFVLQVNLADLAPHDETGLFPPEGLLSFFYDFNEDPAGFDPEHIPGHRMYYFPPNVLLEPKQAPQPEIPLPELSMRFWPASSLPFIGTQAYQRLARELGPGWGEDEFDDHFDEYDEFCREVFQAGAPTKEAPLHHLGGHCHNIQGDMQREAALVTNGIYLGQGITSESDLRKQEELQPTFENWQLLLQIDSDSAADICWGDAGMLYYWALLEDIKRRDFSHTWMTMQCF